VLKGEFGQRGSGLIPLTGANFIHMQVSCPECSAQYEFDSSAIPAEGYDAQCTSCDSIFFVEPEVEGTAAPKVAEEVADEVSSTCPHCGAVYQFATEDIPETGYDAQCTQCDGIFFVSPGTLDGEPGSPNYEPPPEPQAPVQPAVAASAASTENEASVASIAEPVVVSDGSSNAAGEGIQDMLNISMQLGEPAALPEGVSAEIDFERIIIRRKKRVQGAVAFIGVLLGLNITCYFALPQVFDATVGPILGIKAAINPEAIPFVDKAKLTILPDTASAYDNALKSLQKAMELDSQYPEAIAYMGLTHVLKGTDLQTEGRSIINAGAIAADEIHRMQKLSVRKRPKNYTKKVAELRRKAADSNTSSKPFLEKGGQEIAKGRQLLKGGAEAYPGSVMMVLGYGIYKATDSDSASSATTYLKHVLAQLQGGNEELDLKNVPNPWAAYLQGRICLQDPYKVKDAPAAFEAALALMPNMQRARYDLALAYEKLERLDDAIKTAKEILAKESTHQKAIGLLAELENKLKAQKKLAKKGRSKKRGKKNIR